VSSAGGATRPAFSSMRSDHVTRAASQWNRDVDVKLSSGLAQTACAPTWRLRRNQYSFFSTYKIYSRVSFIPRPSCLFAAADVVVVAAVGSFRRGVSGSERDPFRLCAERAYRSFVRSGHGQGALSAGRGVRIHPRQVTHIAENTARL